jgi:amino acid adenylation domain-containing protein
LTPATPGGLFPLTALQRSMVLASRQAPRSGLYVIQDVCTSVQDLDSELLKSAWRLVAQRHPALRTSFVTAAGSELWQRVNEESEISWQELDWTGVAPDEKPDRLAAFLRRDWERGFEFDAGIPMRFALLRMPEHASILIWTVHHALLDGRSLAVVWREWFAFYDALLRGERIRLADPEPFRAHVEWLQRQDLAGAERYWRQCYAGISETTEYVVDRLRRPANGPAGFGKESVTLSAEETSALWDFASRHGITVNNLVQGAWAVLLSRYSGRPDVVFGVTRAGWRASVANGGEMVGLLINTLPFRTAVHPGAALAPWLRQIGEQWAGLRPYEHNPLEKIREWSGLPPGMPLFDSILVYDREPPPETLRKLGGSWLDRTLRRAQRTDVPLTLVAYGRPFFSLEIVYDGRLFARETAVGMARHLRTLLRSFAAQRDAPLAALRMLAAPEEAWLLSELNRTEVPFEKDQCVHRLFERQAAQAPEAAALESEGGAVSYGELNRRANRLARFLGGRGAGPEDLIAICIGRHPEAVVSVVAVLKAGAAFLPLDPSLPPGRLARMLEDARPKLVLVWDDGGPDLASSGREVVNLDRLGSEIARLPSENLPGLATPGNAAYAMYTSGSTGAPKAVVVAHGALLNHTLAASRAYGITRGDRRLQFASPGSDMFVAEVFNYLCNGATLVFCPETRGVSVAEFLRALDELRITVTGVPSSWWNEWVAAIADGAWVPPPALRAVITGMERVSPAAFLKWTQIIGSRVRLFNAYGPTEASPTATIYEAGTSEWEGGPFVPIGKPIANLKAYVLDSGGNPVPAGVPGELYIGGDGLARGYLNAPDLTAERFVPDPFRAAPGSRLYRTGDRVFRLPDGNLVFLGRLDRQVKIRGFRVELAEVEAVLSQHPAVRQCAVVAQDREARQRLVAYVAPAGGQTLDPGDLRLHLCRRLPDHMVPVAFAILPELPKTSSGKVDLLSLPECTPETPLSERARREPATAVEKRLAALWQRVLDIPRAWATDNFFLSGGDSLRAAELLALINREFSLELPMAALLRAPTLAGLASALDGHETQAAPAAGVVVLSFNESGARLPLFCISSVADDPQCFRHVAARLGPDQPLFALAGPDGGSERLQDIEETARRACQAIRRIRPRGPYLLGGYCLGGIVAFESARQLVSMGEEVPLVALFDVPAPGYRRFLRRFGRRARSRGPAARALKPVAFPLVHFMARRDETIGTRILHLLADPRLGWRDLCEKPVRIIRVGGSHATLLHEPHAALIAAGLEALLRGANGRYVVLADTAMDLRYNPML